MSRWAWILLLLAVFTAFIGFSDAQSKMVELCRVLFTALIISFGLCITLNTLRSV